jgi:hypothetical protein
MLEVCGGEIRAGDRVLLAESRCRGEAAISGAKEGRRKADADAISPVNDRRAGTS